MYTHIEAQNLAEVLSIRRRGGPGAASIETAPANDFGRFKGPSYSPTSTSRKIWSFGNCSVPYSLLDSLRPAVMLAKNILWPTKPERFENFFGLHHFASRNRPWRSKMS